MEFCGEWEVWVHVDPGKIELAGEVPYGSQRPLREQRALSIGKGAKQEAQTKHSPKGQDEILSKMN